MRSATATAGTLPKLDPERAGGIYKRADEKLSQFILSPMEVRSHNAMPEMSITVPVYNQLLRTLNELVARLSAVLAMIPADNGLLPPSGTSEM